MTTPPLETEDQARHLPAVAAIYDRARDAPGRGLLGEGSREMLSAALRHAGVETGAYDERILAWLSEWTPQVAAAVAGWVERAHEAGLAAADTGGGGNG